MCARRKQKRIEEARRLMNVFDMNDFAKFVIPAKAGICDCATVDSRLRGNDNRPTEILKRACPVPRYGVQDDKNMKGLPRRFAPRNDTILELGCGSGDYALEMAKMFPKKMFIGVDIQGERLWMGATKALKEKIDNVIFLRIQIEDLEKYFAPKSVDEIWLTFPDPYPTKKQIKKRLTSPRFLEMYKKILKPDGILHLKTDNAGLFDYSLTTIADFGGQIISCADDVDKVCGNPLLQIRTYFENKHRARGAKIKYLRATL